MKYRYEHTQIGFLTIYILILLTIFYLFILVKTDFYWPIFLVMVLILILVASFSSLNVRLDNTRIKLKFGYGLFHKQFLLNDIASIKSVRNKWYYGWGIKVSLVPYMWIYNVSGFDAVEIKMKDNKTYRIGTDEPKKLEKAILEVIKK